MVRICSCSSGFPANIGLEAMIRDAKSGLAASSCMKPNSAYNAKITYKKKYFIFFACYHDQVFDEAQQKEDVIFGMLLLKASCQLTSTTYT